MSDDVTRPMRVVKRSLIISGHATSISLEEPFWIALRQLAHDDKISVAALAARIDGARTGGNLSSALRVHVLQALQGRLQDLSTGDETPVFPADAVSSPAQAGAKAGLAPD